MDNCSIPTTASRRTFGLRLKRRTAAIIGALFGLTSFWWFIPFKIQATANENLLVRDVTIPGVTDQITGEGARKLADGGVLEFRYNPISDSGVRLRRLNRQGDIVWEQYCKRLLSGTVLHSEYYQEVFVYIEGETIRVVSQAGNGKFVERLALNSGKRLSRSVDCGLYGDLPHCIPSYPVPSK